MKYRRLFKLMLLAIVGNRRGLFGFAILFTYIIIAVMAPVLSPYNPLDTDMDNAYLPPIGLGGNLDHPLGTDGLGRDLFSRLVHSARINLVIAFLAATGAAVVGIPAGILAGYLGGKVNRAVQALTDAWLSFPHVVFAIVLIAALGVRWTNLVIAITVIDWTRFARVIRGEVFGVREREFIKVAETMGLSNLLIITSEVLPNILPTILVVYTLELGIVVSVEALMSFVGLGVEPAIVSWGNMIAEGMSYIRTGWWSVVFPVAAIMIIILGLNALGDGLREVTDPRTSRILR
ncbi:TPA: ABC transporter permease [Candidatus Bathyarchaeota archaeon]|nr:ABC transporter permease [Candidatus Bathyarchaeota archaeon]